jgi:NDP-sugar pyrophosphorylase family protein
MKAMVLASGLGTRLRPLTDDRPKALVTIGGRTLLEITLERLRNAGIREVIVNVHHFADQVVNYLAAKDNFGMSIAISRENELLETGGGLKKAAWFFLENGPSALEPFILHNVDVISTIDLGSMVRFHSQRNALATLAVQDRETSRPLLFDGDGLLCGRRLGRDGQIEMVRPMANPRARAFCGIHIISPELLHTISGEGAFSIIPAYLQLAAQGEKIVAFEADEYYWRDLGRPESLLQAERDLCSGAISRIG